MAQCQGAAVGTRAPPRCASRGGRGKPRGVLVSGCAPGAVYVYFNITSRALESDVDFESICDEFASIDVVFTSIIDVYLRAGGSLSRSRGSLAEVGAVMATRSFRFKLRACDRLRLF